MGDALRLAVGTLTALPVRPPGSLEAPVPGRAMALAPATGLVPGLAAGAVAALAGTVLPPLPAAVLAVATLALATRGLHLDGLADTADGLAASYDRERALAVMRTGDVGPTGVAAVVFVLLLQVTALAAVFDGVGAGADLAAVAVVAVAGRVAVPLACVRGVAAARPGGLGAAVAGSVPPAVLASVAVLTAAGCAGAGRLAGLAWWAGAVAVAVALAAAAVVVRRAVRRLGGITGDVIGAGVEVATAAAVVALAAA